MMTKTNVATVIVAGIAIAGAVYLNLRAPEESPAQFTTQSGESSASPTSAEMETGSGQNVGSPSVDATSKSTPPDPRLAALAVSDDNGVIDFIKGPDGKVIQEIDNDPGSLGFKKPLREYTYSGEKVVGLTAYQYFGDRVQVTRTAVSYKPDGSVDQYLESTSYDHREKRGGG